MGVIRMMVRSSFLLQHEEETAHYDLEETNEYAISKKVLND